jgi:hypothetical protein
MFRRDLLNAKFSLCHFFSDKKMFDGNVLSSAVKLGILSQSHCCRVVNLDNGNISELNDPSKKSA